MRLEKGVYRVRGISDIDFILFKACDCDFRVVLFHDFVDCATVILHFLMFVILYIFYVCDCGLEKLCAFL